ncbi:polysaccharide biosynthesis tyrosine autokinase [Alkalicella caledoniensis]|uniref:non-specific protein-tyrosine kinase n=1 Tax=Alkalicella caledoniensis TaxID=2731377 RepID=A0A7G9WCY6_ALKCA|nr:polysaccharide biosynthesis tyrosine autokinase [Alkalicella caledoniensis]QNO16548.1 polysaccharide biosynthesis tyrosine autokinase [Alkalicella caledoniensis]
MDSQEYEIDLRQIFDILFKRLWIIAAIVLVTTTTSAVVSYFFLDRVYEASSSLVILAKADSGNIQYNDVLLNQRLVKTYSEIAKSRSVSTEVIRKLGLNMSHGEFAGKVQVNSVRDTEVIEIRVQDTDPQRAARIADELSSVFMSKIVNFLNIDNIQILDRASVPTSPVKPRPALNVAIAFLLGAMLGVGIVFLMEFLDNTLKNPEDIERHLKLPVLATVPEIEGSQSDINLITYREPKSPISEAYRMLRTNIQFANLDNDLKTIVITSTGPSEGKSTTISNLAITLIGMGHKTLIIDADLRKPKVHKVFNLDNDSGMTNVLMGESLENAVKRIGGIKLDILTSGPIPPNPSELLGSKKMKDFIEECSRSYDFVLIDAPPIGIVTDSAILSSICDGTIFVVAAGEAQKDQTLKAKEMLEKVGKKTLGVVVNKVKITKRNYGTYYNYYYAEEK